MIKLYTQEPNVCAATCCCMVVKHSLDDVRKKSEEIDGKGADWITLANWSKIASAYGYTTNHTNSLGNPASGTLSQTYSVLKSGYPVIAQINTGANIHWVVICKFNGYDITDPSNYLCADPSSGTIVSLNTAVRYNEVSSYIIFQ